MSEPGWPPEVKPVTIGDLKRLGIGPDNQLFWDGRGVEVRRRLALTWPQSILAALAAMATIATGVNNLSVFLCGRNVHLLGCPAPPSFVVAPAARDAR